MARRFNLIENQESLLDITPDILPYIPAECNIEIQYTGNGVKIYSKNIAGSIFCQNGDEICISPKYSTIDPFALSAYMGDYGINTTQHNILLSESSKKEASFFLDRIYEMFVASLYELSSKNIKFTRNSRIGISDAFNGTVDWSRTYRHNIANGYIAEAVSKTTYSNYDIIENVLISLAAAKIIPLYASHSTEFKLLLPWATKCQKSNYSHYNLSNATRKIHNIAYGSHAFYYVPCVLAMMILGINHDMTIFNDENKTLFNMPDLYEACIRKAATKVFTRNKVSVVKGFTPKKYFLNSLDGERSELIPDVVIYEADNVKAIIDAKYKIPDNDDYYQMYAYMNFAGINKIFIATPEPAIPTLKTFDGRAIHHIHLDDVNNFESILLKNADDILY